MTDPKNDAPVEFRAGVLRRQGDMIIADPTRGSATFTKRLPSKVELLWVGQAKQDRFSFTVGRATADFVEQCKTGRVLLLKNLITNEEVFLWLQDKSTAHDAEYLAAIKELFGAVEKKPSASSSAKEPARPTTTVELSDFQKLLATISDKNKDINLADVISSPRLTEAVRADPTFFESRLREFLPHGDGASTDIIEEIKNPQVSAAAAALSTALRDPNAYKELCKSFGIPEESPNAGTLAFLKGISKSTKKL